MSCLPSARGCSLGTLTKKQTFVPHSVSLYYLWPIFPLTLWRDEYYSENLVNSMLLLLPSYFASSYMNINDEVAWLETMHVKYWRKAFSLDWLFALESYWGIYSIMDLFLLLWCTVGSIELSCLNLLSLGLDTTFYTSHLYI